jgi:hypothetical protein
VVVVGIAAESAGDVRRIRGLVDRLLCEIAWIEPEVLDAYRRWVGLGTGQWLDLHEAWRLARDRRLPIYGHFSGLPGEVDAGMHRAVFLLFAEESPPPNAVIVSRDTDDVLERLGGWEQAKAGGEWPFVVIGALAQPEFEAWLIASWQPEGPDEVVRHAELSRLLGFDPVRNPERLSAGRRRDPRDAKRVLNRLVEGGRSADDRWADGPLEQLVRNGHTCGLAAFMASVREELAPLLEAPTR